LFSNTFDLCPALRHFLHLFGSAYANVQLQKLRLEPVLQKSGDFHWVEASSPDSFEREQLAKKTGNRAIAVLPQAKKRSRDAVARPLSQPVPAT
jgi:hypothetical protein